MSNTLNYNLERLSDARDSIAQAIKDKGGIVGNLDGFEDFPDDIRSIPSGGNSSFILNNVNAKPSLKSEFTDFPYWGNSNIVSEISSSPSIYGNSIWTDGEHTYYSYNGSSIKIEYNESLNMWIYRPSSYGWGIGIYGNCIWTDGEDIYYSRYYSGSYNQQYVLDKTTNSWISKTWNFSNGVQPSNWNGTCIWTDGTNTYMNSSANNAYPFVLDKATSTWVVTSWNITITHGSYIWKDGDNIYYSYQNNQYVLNKNTMQWETKNWTYSFDYRGFIGNGIWTDGTNTYINSSYSYGSSSTGYVSAVLNKSTDTWTNKTWSNMSNWTSGSIWNYNDDVYYMNSSSYAKLNKTTGEFESCTFRFADNNSLVSSGVGGNIWYNGSDIYYSSGTTQYIFDKNNEVFLNTTWTGLTSFDGQFLWSDGDNIYYSNSSTQYVLDKNNKTWSTKTWNGLTSFYGSYIWTDGENIYYSYASNQYVLDVSTSTWTTKTWNGLTNFNGNSIWTDGENIYCYNNYVLNKDTSTWTPTSINSNINSAYIWTDGEYIYSNNYAYNKTNNSAVSVFSNITAYNIWTDGENIYHNTSTGVQKLIKNRNPISITFITTPNSRLPFSQT